MSETVRAIAFDTPGAPEALHSVQVPLPEPGAGEARIRVAGAGVHQTDVGSRGSGPRGGSSLEPPHVPGMSLSGTVEAVGDGSAWSVGDRVIAITMPFHGYGGAYREAIILPDSSIARAPENLDLVEAGVLAMNGLTALQVLGLLDLAPGATLAVTGATGALAALAIPLAASRGLTVIAEAAPGDEEYVRSLGAQIVVPRSDDPASAVRAVVPDGVDGVLDTAVYNERIVPAIADGGVLASVRGWDGDGESRVKVATVGVLKDRDEAHRLDELVALIDSGAITPRPVTAFAPDDAPEAHRAVEAGGRRAGVVIDFTRS